MCKSGTLNLGPLVLNDWSGSLSGADAGVSRLCYSGSGAAEQRSGSSATGGNPGPLGAMLEISVRGLGVGGVGLAGTI